MGHAIATIGLGPLLWAQGRMVRRRIPKLPEPTGPREGTTGSGPLVRLLVIGDSAAAGVGVDHQRDALLGHIVATLAIHRRVDWTLLAKTGATTATTTAALRKLHGRTFDAVVISLGVNDVTSGVRLATWRRRQAALRAALRRDLGARLVLACGLPPVHGFPALPQPLRWYLGRRARQFDRALKADATAEPGCVYLALDFAPDLSGMATDGFHPGPPIYKAWGERAGALIGESHAVQPDRRS